MAEPGYQVAVEQFQGPLDLLLQLIEERELEITEISLAEITDSFIQHLDDIEELYPEELADFLVIATRLIYLKSRALLPFLEPEVEESASQLADHLRMYKEFRDASEVLSQRIAEGNYAIPRTKSLKQQSDAVEFSPPETVTTHQLATVFSSLMDRMQTIIRIPKAAIRKAVTLKEKISALAELLKNHKQLMFTEMANQSDKADIVVTFLAVLELVKQSTVNVEQPNAFSDIVITHNSSQT